MRESAKSNITGHKKVFFIFFVMWCHNQQKVDKTVGTDGRRTGPGRGPLSANSVHCSERHFTLHRTTRFFGVCLDKDLDHGLTISETQIDQSQSKISPSFFQTMPSHRPGWTTGGSDITHTIHHKETSYSYLFGNTILGWEEKWHRNCQNPFVSSTVSLSIVSRPRKTSGPQELMLFSLMFIEYTEDDPFTLIITRF